MSHTYPTAASSSSSSSNFQLIIDEALDTYKTRTKMDLREHPLADQLQICDSPRAILTVLQQQAQETKQSRSIDGRRTKWLDPTVKVLHFFVKVLGVAGGPVCLRICTSLEICSLIFMWQVLPSSNLIFAGIGELLSVCILINFARAIVTHTSFRQLKAFEQTKALFSTYLSKLKCFSDVSRSTQQCRRPHWQK
jgi:hypothetical protein